MLQLPGDFEDKPLDGRTVLLAEDEERLRIIVAMMIEELGAEVITAADGMSALDAYRQHSGEVDLVLLDMRMTGLSGTTTFEKLLEINPHVKVVLSSGVSPDEHVVSMLEQKKGGFIEKPFNLDRLGEVLHKVLNGESAIRRL